MDMVVKPGMGDGSGEGCGNAGVMESYRKVHIMCLKVASIRVLLVGGCQLLMICIAVLCSTLWSM